MFTRIEALTCQGCQGHVTDSLRFKHGLECSTKGGWREPGTDYCSTRDPTKFLASDHPQGIACCEEST